MFATLRALARFAAVLALASTVGRAQTLAVWVDPISGNWNDPTRWSINPLFPNNGTPPGSTYVARIAASGSPYTVTLNTPIAVSGLDLTSAAATLRILDNVALSAGTIHLEGGRILL